MFRSVPFAALMAAAALSCGTAKAEPLFAFLTPPTQIAPQVEPQAVEPAPADERDDAKLVPRLKRQIVDYASKEAPGTVIIDTPHTFLYYVLGNGKAMRYGIGVGREGFTWSGVRSSAASDVYKRQHSAFLVTFCVPDQVKPSRPTPMP